MLSVALTADTLSEYLNLVVNLTLLVRESINIHEIIEYLEIFFRKKSRSKYDRKASKCRK